MKKTLSVVIITIIFTIVISIWVLLILYLLELRNRANSEQLKTVIQVLSTLGNAAIAASVAYGVAILQKNISDRRNKQIREEESSRFIKLLVVEFSENKKILDVFNTDDKNLSIGMQLSNESWLIAKSKIDLEIEDTMKINMFYKDIDILRKDTEGTIGKMLTEIKEHFSDAKTTIEKISSTVV